MIMVGGSLVVVVGDDNEDWVLVVESEIVLEVAVADVAASLSAEGAALVELGTRSSPVRLAPTCGCASGFDDEPSLATLDSVVLLGELINSGS